MTRTTATFAVLSLVTAGVLSTVVAATGMLVASSVSAGAPVAHFMHELAFSQLQLSLMRDVAPFTLAASALLVGLALVYALRQGVIRARAVTAALSCVAFVAVSLASVAFEPSIVATELIAVVVMVELSAVLGIFVGAAVHPLLRRSAKFNHGA